MTFQSLLVCKDEQATDVLTSALAGFGLGVQCCGYPDALCRLTEQKFDAVIVDYDDPHSAALVLQNAYQSSAGGNTVTVALLNDKTKVRHVFGAGANFVLYKPVSQQQAEASLRAAIALMKRERRRSFRVPVQLPVKLRVESGAEMEGILLDLSEDGLDVLAAQPLCPAATVNARFILPDQTTEIDLRGEVAWANPNGESGVRYTDLPDNLRQTLREWVVANAAEFLPEDPEPVSECRLSDLSLGGCYVETESPFPERSGIVLCLKAAGMEVQAEGLVRVMHPEWGLSLPRAQRNSGSRWATLSDFSPAVPEPCLNCSSPRRPWRQATPTTTPAARLPWNLRISCLICSIAPIRSARKSFSRSFANNAIPRKLLRPNTYQPFHLIFVNRKS